MRGRAGFRVPFTPVRWVGAVVIFSSVAYWLATPLCLLLPPAVLAWRTGLEERMLEQAYREEYRNWARRTRPLIPYLL